MVLMCVFVLQIQRILLEAFTNILRHSQASQVIVKAQYQHTPPSLILAVSDNSIGLPNKVSDPDTVTGHGLRNMRARAAAIGATVTLSLNPHSGTLVKLILPFE